METVNLPSPLVCLVKKRKQGNRVIDHGVMSCMLMTVRIIREWSEGGKTHNSPVDPYEETNAFEVYKDLCDDFGVEREDLIEEH